MVNFKHFVYGGIDSADYGVYISGEGVFNAPERAVELVTVAGRNGAVAIDQGHWENIEVVYPAGMFAADQTEFRTRLADFRNALKSQIGYQRLQDDYHPNEYREALIIDAVEVSPAHMATAGEFDIIFNCKPQRFLTSGETAITVTSGNTLTNPTPYDAQPLIMAKGYGTITVGGYEIELTNETFGTVELSPRKLVHPYGVRFDDPWVIDLADKPMNVGDTINSTFALNITFTASGTVADLTRGTMQQTGPVIDKSGSVTAIDAQTFKVSFWIVPDYTKNTASVGVVAKIYAPITMTIGGTAASFTQYLTVKYYGADNKITVEYDAANLPASITPVSAEIISEKITAESTASILGNPTYIDCDIGECYKVENGKVVDLNRYIDLGSDLPKLSGTTTITYDNTFTEMKIIPRWWQL